MSSENPTQQEIKQGYIKCDCGHGIELLRDMSQVKLYPCERCFKAVADSDEFFNIPVEILSK